MTWRLGTWSSEAHFARLDELLRLASTLPNWPCEQSLLQSGDYGAYWSLVWQLQVAEHLVKSGFTVTWGGSGPDLEAKRYGENVSVECYSYQKSFGLEQFLEDILHRIDPHIRVQHDLFRPLPLRSARDKHAFLDAFFSPYLDDRMLNRARQQATITYPVPLSTPPGANGLRVYYDGDEPGEYDPVAAEENIGDPMKYIEHAVNDAIGAKQSSNALDSHRPNALAINLLLSSDFQAATYLRPDARFEITLPPSLDAVIFGCSGIGDILTAESLTLLGPDTHILASISTTLRP